MGYVNFVEKTVLTLIIDIDINLICCLHHNTQIFYKYLVIGNLKFQILNFAWNYALCKTS